MIISQKEIYNLGIRIDVEGDKKVQAKLKGVDKYLDRTQKKAKKLEKMKVGWSGKLKDIASPSIEKIKNSYNRLKKTMGGLDWKAFGGKIGNAFKHAGQMALKYGAIIGMVLGGISVADTINKNIDFGATMSKVQAISQASTQEMADLEKAARHLGATTKWTAAEAGQAEVALSQMGFTPQQTIKALPSMLDLASAGELELGNAAEIVAGTLNAFNLEADQATRVADVLAQASRKSGTNVELLGETFKYVAPTAAGLKMSIEETAASVGILANMNIKGSMAGTTMTAMLNDLTQTSDKAAAAMAKINFKAFDENGEMKKFPDMMKEISAGLQGLTSEQQNSILQDIFGTRAAKGMRSFLAKGPEEIDKMLGFMEHSQGAAHEMSETMIDNLKGDIAKLRSAVDEEQLKVGEKTVGPIRKFIQGLTAKIPDIGKAIMPFIEKIAAKIEKIDVAKMVDKTLSVAKAVYHFLSGAFGVLSMVFKPIIKGIGWIIDNLSKLPPGVLEALGVATAIVFAITKIGAAISLLAGPVAAVSFMLSPWTIVIGAVVGLVYLLAKNWEKVSAWITEASKKLLEFFGLTEEERAKNPSEYYFDREGMAEKYGYKSSKEEEKPAEKPVAEQMNQNVTPTAVDTEMFPKEIQDMMNQANQAMDNGMNEMKTGATEGMGQMTQAVVANRADFVNAGTDLVMGLVEGIQGATEAAVNAIVATTQAIVAAAKANLKIASPSKVFEDIGEFLPLGLVDGIEKKWDLVKQAARGFTDKAKEGAEEVTDEEQTKDNPIGFRFSPPAQTGQGYQPTLAGAGGDLKLNVSVQLSEDPVYLKQQVENAMAEFGSVLLEALTNRQK